MKTRKEVLAERIAQELDSPEHQLHLGLDQIGELALALSKVVLETLDTKE